MFQRWNDVTMLLPDDGQRVLAWMTHQSGSYSSIMDYKDKGFETVTGTPIIIDESASVTHWMELPRDPASYDDSFDGGALLRYLIADEEEPAQALLVLMGELFKAITPDDRAVIALGVADRFIKKVGSFDKAFGETCLMAIGLSLYAERDEYLNGEPDPESRRSGTFTSGWPEDLLVINLINPQGKEDGYAYRDDGSWRSSGGAVLSLERLRAGWSWYAYKTPDSEETP